jgi:hypothetical protein
LALKTDVHTCFSFLNAYRLDVRRKTTIFLGEVSFYLCLLPLAALLL